ncbi:hypothetical protein D3C72_1967300 [compost metagenome]
MPAQHLFHQLMHRGFVADIAGVVLGPASRGGNFFAHGAQLVRVAAHKRRRGTQRRELMRDTAADTAAASGNDDDPAREQAGPEY